MVGVDVIEADGLEADPRLIGAGIPDGDFLPLQDFGAAGLVESNGVGHVFSWRFKSACAREGGTPLHPP